MPRVLEPGDEIQHRIDIWMYRYRLHERVYLYTEPEHMRVIADKRELERRRKQRWMDTTQGHLVIFGGGVVIGVSVAAGAVWLARGLEK